MPANKSSAFTLPAPAPMPNPLSMLAVGISVIYELVATVAITAQVIYIIFAFLVIYV
jgi:hypothetical protein